MANKKLAKFVRRRLEEHKSIEGISQNEFAKKIGLSSSELTRITKGERQSPTMRVLYKVADGLKIPYEEIMEAAGYSPRDKVQTTFSKDADMVKMIPIYGVIPAGEPMYAEENVIGYEPVNVTYLKSGEYFCLKVTGDSMIDAGIADGSTILGRQQRYCYYSPYSCKTPFFFRKKNNHTRFPRYGYMLILFFFDNKYLFLPLSINVTFTDNVCHDRQYNGNQCFRFKLYAKCI